MFKNIVFWLEFPLFHMSPFIKSVSEVIDANVIVVCEKQIPQWRLDMGFVQPDFGDSNVYVQPTRDIRNTLVKKYSSKETVHVFHGLRGVKENYKCFKSLAGKQCSVGLYFEPSVLHGSFKAILRKFLYRFLFFRIDKNVDFMLALGDLGRNQYIGLGLNKDKVYSFPYFIDDDKIISKRLFDNKRLVKLLFVGQLIPRKNVLLLIQAVNNVVGLGIKIQLDIVGDGILKDDLKRTVSSLGLDNIVFFLGSKNQAELQDIFLNHDAFILPSKFDGWGCVAVEAMASGLPIIVSDSCGSASVVSEKEHGFVVESNSLSSLTSKIEFLVDNIYFYNNEKTVSSRLDYVRKNLSASSGAAMLADVFNKIGK